MPAKNEVASELENPTHLIGHQAIIDWMGTATLTLHDLWPDEVRAMIVGTNPAPTSVAVGHYYQGKYGQRQLGRLAQYGLFPASSTDQHLEESALSAGVGFLDLVKRPTVDATGPTREEKAFGRRELMSVLEARKAPLVVCVFSDPVKALLGTKGVLGFQPEHLAWGGRVFRMPGPNERLAVVDEVMRTLAPA